MAIETTGATCGVCVAEMSRGELRILSIVETFVENVHDQMLAVHTQQALADSALTINDVDVVAVSGGPGSFTGTRIGVSFAKGLCFSGNPKLLVVDTMEALAAASSEVAHAVGKDLCVVIPSHRDLYFAARFDILDSTTTRRSEDQHAVAILLSRDAVKTFSNDLMVVGPASRDIDAHAISGLTRLSSRFIALNAARMITRADANFTYSDPLHAEPLYRQEFR